MAGIGCLLLSGYIKAQTSHSQGNPSLTKQKNELK